MSTTYVDDVFGGVTVSTVTCLGCETVRYYINVLTIYTVTLLGLIDGYFSILFCFQCSEMKQDFLDLSLPVPSDKVCVCVRLCV